MSFGVCIVVVLLEKGAFVVSGFNFFPLYFISILFSSVWSNSGKLLGFIFEFFPRLLFLAIPLLPLLITFVCLFVSGILFSNLF